MDYQDCHMLRNTSVWYLTLTITGDEILGQVDFGWTKVAIQMLLKQFKNAKLIKNYILSTYYSYWLVKDGLSSLTIIFPGRSLNRFQNHVLL